MPVLRRAARVLLRPGGIAERIGTADPHVKFAPGDPVEDLTRTPAQFPGVSDVIRT